ncbi:MAG: TrkA C-terminal domain-containing protein [Brevinematia bacterium]
MKVFLIGEGDIVDIIVEEFIKNNVDVYLVSSEPHPSLTESYEKVEDYSKLDENFFREKEVDSFDKCIIALREEKILEMINISSLLAQLGADVLAILPNRKYESIFNKLGINFTVPSYDTAFKTVGEILLKSGPVENVLPFVEDYFVARVNIPPDSKICNKKVSELDLRNKFNISIIVAFRKDYVLLEKGVLKGFEEKIDVKAHTVLTENMSIIIVGPLDGIKKFIDYLYYES